MASNIRTFGTVNTTALKALPILPGPSQFTADIATLNAYKQNSTSWSGYQNSQGWEDNATQITPTGFYMPNRGIIPWRPGDWVVVDPTTGWSWIMDSVAIASANITHS